MCRFVAYLGKEICLDELLLKPEHSLVEQSYKPHEMTSGYINADGFGVGWYDFRFDPNPAVYRRVLPIWNDTDFPTIASHLASTCVMGIVRSATPGLAVAVPNTGPYSAGNFLFAHNGLIEDFLTVGIRHLRRSLPDRVYSEVRGTTDSEHIFALFRARLQDSDPTLDDLVGAAREGVQWVAGLAAEFDIGAVVNTAWTDGRRLVATRFAFGHTPATLYIARARGPFPDAVVVVSEPLVPGAAWEPIPENSIVAVDQDLRATIEPL